MGITGIQHINYQFGLKNLQEIIIINSSRIATRRIANYAGDELDQLIESTGYISNYSSSSNGGSSSKNNATSDNTGSKHTLGSLSDSNNITESSKKTNSDGLMSIINAVATATNTMNDTTKSIGSSFVTNLRPPSAKKLKTKGTMQKVQSAPAFVLNSVNSGWQQPSITENTASQESLTQDSELAKLASFTNNGASSVHSVSISPSPNSSSSFSSIVSSSSAVSSNNNPAVSHGPSFVEPIYEATHFVTQNNLTDTQNSRTNQEK